MGASAGAWSPKADSVTYQWYRDGKKITKKGTSRTYVLTTADKGKDIKVRVTAHKTDYASKSRVSSAVTVAG